MSLSRRAASLLLVAFLASPTFASSPQPGPYDPNADAAKALAAAGERAAKEKKRVLVVVGGNWCVWCRALDRLMNEDATVKSAVAASYVLVHLNYSKENKNEALLEKYGRPDKLGFPVLLVLSPKLDLVTTQESGSLETGDKDLKGHDPAKVLAFLAKWKA